MLKSFVAHAHRSVPIDFLVSCARSRPMQRVPDREPGQDTALAKAAEAVDWLASELESERNETKRRHDALVEGLVEALELGTCAPRIQTQRSYVSTAVPDGYPSQRETVFGGLPRTSNGVVSGWRQPEKSTRGERKKRMFANRMIHQNSTQSRSQELSEGTDTPIKKEVRTTAELTDLAVQDRGLNQTGPTLSLKDVAQAIRFRHPPLLQRICLRVAQNPWFDYLMSAIIFTNCVVIGLEIQESVDKTIPTSLAYQVMETCFLVAYILELSIRLLADWQECLQNSWFQMDIVLVMIGVVTVWVLEPLLLMRGAIGMLDKVLVVRVLRLLRLVRTLRFLKFMQPLWKLVQSLLRAHGSVTAAGMLLFGAIYVFACAGVAVIGVDEELLADPVVGHIVEDRFRSIPVLMLTLLEFVHSDGAAQIYHPLLRTKPWLLFYFLPILLVVPIALMNLITAVIVNHVIKVSSRDTELERVQLRGRLEALIPILNSLFRQFDSEGQGYIRWADLDSARMGAPQTPLPAEVLHALKSYKLEDFFKLLDADGSGMITQAEWVDGMCCLVLEEMPIENLQVLHMLYRQANDLEELKSALLPRCPVPESRRSDYNA